MNNSVRRSNLELLRIASMLLIVMSHTDNILGFRNLYGTSLGIEKIITECLDIGGQIGVGCFVLISSYFMVEKNTSIIKILKLVGQVHFYSIGIWLLWVIYNIYIGLADVRAWFVETLDAFFPILLGQYWFVTAYVLLMILSPFFNKLVFAMSRKEYQGFLAIILIIFVILGGGIPSVFPNMFEGKIVPVFIIYFIGGYIRRFVDCNHKNASRHFCVSIIFYALLFIVVYLMTFIGVKLNSSFVLEKLYFYKALNSPFVVIICVELFLTFFKLDIKYRKTINVLASHTFGVYLLHSNRLVDKWLTNILSLEQGNNFLFIIVYSFLTIMGIFVIGILVDYLRTKTYEKAWMAFCNNKLVPLFENLESIAKLWYLQGTQWLMKFYKK